jgi:hypothetical protein
MINGIVVEDAFTIVNCLKIVAKKHDFGFDFYSLQK